MKFGLGAYIRLKVAIKHVRNNMLLKKKKKELKENRLMKIYSKFITCSEKMKLMKKYGKTTRQNYHFNFFFFQIVFNLL